MTQALANLRICDFSGQLAGAGATRLLAGFGAEVIRIEDPTNEGRWDILRGIGPFVDERRGIDLSGSFNTANTGKFGCTINLKTDRGKELLTELVKRSDVVTENFAAGVLERLGFGYDELKAIKPDIIYVSNCGFGHTGPYKNFKTWGPIVQAVSGLTFTSGLPDQPPAGWGYSYMDHTGAYYMAIAILMALRHRNRTGEGQWVDLSCTEAGAGLHGPAILDYTVNGRRMRREGNPNSNRNYWPRMAPHGIFRAVDDDSWVAIACRNDDDWRALASVIDKPWASDDRWTTLQGRVDAEDELEELIGAWTIQSDKFATAQRLQEAGVPASAVQTPEERIDKDPNTSAWGLWPENAHTAMGNVRSDGIPMHLSVTDWHFDRAGHCLGEHNDHVFGDLLGLTAAEIDQLREEKVI